MKQVIENIQRFIQARRDYYEAEIEPVTQQSWSATTWGNQSTGWLSIRAGKSSMAHTEISRMKGFESQVIADRDYVDFIKAVVVHQYEKAPANRKPSPQSLLLTHLTLKRIYAGLRATRQQTNPIYIDTSVFQYIDETLVSVGYKNVFDAMTNANTVQRLLILEGLTLTAPQYEHKHTADNKKNRGKVARKAVEEGVVDDWSRDDDEQRLITFAALKGFAAITTSPRHYWEELGCRVVDLLFCTGLRGDEVLFLPRDCWVTRPLRSKETGMPLIAVDGSPMEQHGIRYYAEKHAENRIHWFESNAAPIARRAYLRILELTNPFHQHARWIVESGGKHILNWNESTVTESDLINHIIESNVRYTETKDKRPLYQRLQNGVRSWVKARKLSPIGFQTRLGALHGCPKKLKCLQGGGCGNLLATGRPGELEGLERNYTNMAAHLEQLERHQANDPAYEEALQESREMTNQMKITVERAREARDKNLVLQVFPSGLLHNVSRPETLADRFAAALPDSNQSQEESRGAAR